MPSVQWRMFSTVGDIISTIEGSSTVEDAQHHEVDIISTLEGVQCCGGIPSVLWS